MPVTETLSIYADTDSDGSKPLLFAIDKATGEEVGRIEVPATSRYGMSSWMHEGKQYIVLQTGSSLTALTLPN